MPVSYSLQSGVLTLVASGKYAPEEIPRQFLAGLGDPACPIPVGLLLDVRRSEVLAGRHPDQIRTVAEFLKPYADRIGRRCAVVVTHDAHFGLSRMGAVYAERVGVDAQVFRAMDEALAWLRASSSTAT